MPGTVLPPELVELIVSYVLDTDSLKSCSFSASVFVPSCQKRLLRKLELSSSPSGRFRTWTEAEERFAEAPHLAGYITKLTIGLEDHAFSPNTLEFIRAVSSVLSRLSNVQNCILEPRGCLFWDRYSPVVVDSILDWLQRVQPLQSLRLSNFANLPLKILPRVLCAAGALHVWNIRLDPEDQSYSTYSDQPATGTLTSLSCENSSSITLVLRRHDLVRYLRNLRRIVVFPGASDPYLVGLFFAAADTLEEITLYFDPVPYHDLQPTYPTVLPALSIFTINTSYLSLIDTNTAPLITPLFSDVLSPDRTPMLQELIIEVRLAFIAPQYDFHKPTMQVLDHLFVAHPSLTTVRWRPHFRVQVAETNRSAHFEAFFGGLRQAIPAAFASQRIRVVVEQIPEFEGYFD